MPDDVPALPLWIVVHGVVLVTLGPKVHGEAWTLDAPLFGDQRASVQLHNHLLLAHVFYANVSFLTEELGDVDRTLEQFRELDGDDAIHVAIVHIVQDVPAARQLLQLTDAHLARFRVADGPTLVQPNDEKIEASPATTSISGWQFSHCVTLGMNCGERRPCSRAVLSIAQKPAVAKEQRGMITTTVHTRPPTRIRECQKGLHTCLESDFSKVFYEHHEYHR